MTSGMIFDVKRYAINDGPGIRTAVFMKGCPLRCWWCHNPEGQSVKKQLIFRINRCKESKACIEACPLGAISWKDGTSTDWEICDHCGKCAEICYAGAREIVGREINLDQLMIELERDIPFYDQSGGGVTFTGGEPLQQRKFLQEALMACKQQNIRTAVDTSGSTAWGNFESILPLTDLFLYDVKHMDAEKHRLYTTVSNGKILNNLQKLSNVRANIIVRIPIIPGMNDDAKNLTACGAFLADLPHLEGVELMPYHEIGVAKYQALGMLYKMGDTVPPNTQQICEIEELFINYGVKVIRHSSGRTQ